jgi:hypothetical protein
MERLPLPALEAMELYPGLDLDVAVTAERLLPRGLPALEGFAAQLRTDAVSLRLEELRAKLDGGALQGSLRLAYGLLPRLSVEGNFADIVLAAPLTGRPLDIAAGRLSGGARLEAEGSTPAVLIAGLSGEGSLGLRDGVVQGFDAPAAAAALGWADPAAAEAALRTALAGGATPIERGEARFTLREGVLTLEHASLGGEAGLVLGLAGRVDLPRDRMDLRLSLPVPEGAPVPALHLTGPSMNPLREPDIAAWLAWRAANPP